MKRRKLAILIGNGSRLPAIYTYCQKPDTPWELAVILSYKKEASMEEWIRQHNLSFRYHRWSTYKHNNQSREEYNDDLANILDSYDVDIVFGVGWNIIWTPGFLQRFKNRVINAHPFPLPDEPRETIVYNNQVIPVLRGMNTLRRAWDHHLPFTGASVHFASEAVDVGEVLARDFLAIHPAETFPELEKRHIALESKVIITALQKLDERIQMFNAKVEMKKNVLVIGNGGREHAMIWKLAQSSQVGKIYCAPGNAGTEKLAENIPVQSNNLVELLKFAQTNDISLTIVGPEVPLSMGIVDLFERHGLKIFGPSKAAAQLESSKAWAMEFMHRHAIPHPGSKAFMDLKEAKVYVQKHDGPFVVKADGLAQGKGVFMCSTREQAEQAIDAVMAEKQFGSAGEKVLIQETLTGYEVSVMAFCDGKIAVPLVAAQDHKRVFDRDRGPNTGGMGAYAPAPVSPVLLKKMQRLLTLTVEGMAEEGIPYKGILYGGFMVVDNEPYVLEYNCRFGDPETEVQLPLLASDLYDCFEQCVNGNLSPMTVRFTNNACVTVVLTSAGYPGSYKTGVTIHGLDKPLPGNIMIFHAGTGKQANAVVTTSGRVLNVVAESSDLEQAIEDAYGVIGTKISFDQMHYRTDIGAKGIRRRTKQHQSAVMPLAGV